MIKRIFIYLVFAIISYSAVGFVNAQTVVPDKYWVVGSSGRYNYDISDPDAACRAFTNGFTNGWSYYSSDPPVGNNASCYYKGINGSKNRYGDVKFKSCPSNLPYFDQRISSGTVEYGACKAKKDDPPPPSCPKDSPGSGTWQAGKSDGSSYVSPFQTGGCVNSCKVEMEDVKSCYAYSDGFDYCTYTWKSVGTTCAAGDGTQSDTAPPNGASSKRTEVPPFSPPSGKCPKGTVQGGIDSAGIPICIGTGTDPKNAPPASPKAETSKDEVQPDGSTKNTKTEVITNSDGSTTTNTTITVTRPDGTKETSGNTVTSEKPSGGAGKADTPDQDKFDLCKQNPTLTICRNSSVTGSCGEIACVGDAIQCATLRAAAMMQCEQKADKDALDASPLRAMGQQILDGSDPIKGEIDAALKGSEVDMSQPNLDDSGFVSSRSCLAPRSFTVAGKAISVSFDELCDNIEPLRYAVLACAWIIAYLVVSRSVLNS